MFGANRVEERDCLRIVAAPLLSDSLHVKDERNAVRLGKFFQKNLRGLNGICPALDRAPTLNEVD
jgi:hypothetical protein